MAWGATPRFTGLILLICHYRISYDHYVYLKLKAASFLLSQMFEQRNSECFLLTSVTNCPHIFMDTHYFLEVYVILIYNVWLVTRSDPLLLCKLFCCFYFYAINMYILWFSSYFQTLTIPVLSKFLLSIIQDYQSEQ